MYVHARSKSSEKYLNSVNNENEECWDRNIGVRASMQVNKNVLILELIHFSLLTGACSNLFVRHVETRPQITKIT